MLQFEVMPGRRKLIFASTATVLAAMVTISIAALMVYLKYHPAEWVRISWNLSPTEDDWSTLHVQLIRSHFTLINERQTQPAFMGEFVGDTPFSPNRTDPVGVRWERSPQALPWLGVGRGFGDSPPPLARIGVAWQRDQTQSTVFGNYQIRRSWFDLNLYLPLTLIALLTSSLVFATHRATLPHRRARKGLCTTCGYDLRGSCGRCPECGVVN